MPLKRINIVIYKIEANDQTFLTKHVVLGTGRPPFIPHVFQKYMTSDRVFHLSRYKSASEALLKRGAKKIAVIGSSQSAVEIILHLTKIEPKSRYILYLGDLVFH